MTPLEIQFELRKRGILQKLIACEEDKSEMAVSKVINKSMISKQLMRAVAQKIDKEMAYVFPEYYQAKLKNHIDV